MDRNSHRFVGDFSIGVDGNSFTLPRRLILPDANGRTLGVLSDMVITLETCNNGVVDNRFDRFLKKIKLGSILGLPNNRDYTFINIFQRPQNGHVYVGMSDLEVSGETLVIPEHMKRIAGIEDEAIMAGFGDSIRIFEPGTWDEYSEIADSRCVLDKAPTIYHNWNTMGSDW